ncbi:hypothetical protein L596_024918 [Steinernema carpocapsae]|uniref:Chorein N-terminal domain-containing protein n=1 Tax=Steinernema carpocapsae TaxID=34508 RepID=A0A4U5M681_STECR|nr:hypothetical protein L596_024918 [Steinernema carpocapsae]
MLDELEEFHKKQLLQALGIPVPDDTTKSQGSWWGASLVSAVVNNIQLILTNVHIRYEDDVSLPNNYPFNCGVRIQKISVQTTNEQWIPVFVPPENRGNVFKILDLQGLSIYWNSGQKINKEVLSYKDLQKTLAPEDTRNNSFILHPFNVSLRMEKNASKFPLQATKPSSPRFKFEFCPDKVNIELTKRQFAEIRLLCREWARFDRARQHRKWRPVTSISQNCKKWWNFAYQRIAEPMRKQKSSQTWSFAYERAKQLNAYCRAYRERLISIIEKERAKHNSENGTTQNVTLSKEDLMLMKQIERDSQYAYDDLTLFRETVFRTLMREREAEMDEVSVSESESGVSIAQESEAQVASSTESTDGREPKPKKEEKVVVENKAEDVAEKKEEQLPHSPSLNRPPPGADQTCRASEDGGREARRIRASGSSAGHEGSTSPAQPAEDREKQIEDEILDVLNESWDDSTVLRRDALLAEVTLNLERITIRFVDVDEEHIFGRTRVLATDLWNVTGRMHLSPRYNSTTLDLSVSDMSIQRLQTESTRDKNKSNGSNGNIEESFDRLDDENELFRDTSLIYGTTESCHVHETAKLLLAIGKTSESLADSDNYSEFEGEAFPPAPPFFEMIYRRRAPKLIARHTLEVTFSSVSVMYDEDALDGLTSLFDMDSAFADQESSDDSSSSFSRSLRATLAALPLDQDSRGAS